MLFGYTGHRPVLREVGGYSANVPRDLRAEIRVHLFRRTAPRPSPHPPPAAHRRSYAPPSRAGGGDRALCPCSRPPVQLAQFLRCNVCSESRRHRDLSTDRHDVAYIILPSQTYVLRDLRIHHHINTRSAIHVSPRRRRRRRRCHYAPTIVLERLRPVGADRRGGSDRRGPAGRARSAGRGGRGDVRPAAERHRERADQPERPESGAGPGRRPVPDYVHGRRAVSQLGVCRRSVGTPADGCRVHRVQVQQPTQAGRQEESFQTIESYSATVKQPSRTENFRNRKY